MSDVQTRSSCPVSHVRLTRSGGVARPASAIVVTGVNLRGLIPRRCWRLIDAATVLRETVSPSSRRSARIRGEP